MTDTGAPPTPVNPTETVTFREPILVAATPYPGASQVVLYADTWHIHVPHYRKFPGIQDRTLEALESPKVVLAGTTAPGNVIFVHSTFTSPRNQSPFAVIVDPEGNPMPAVASISFRRDLKDLTQFTTLWLPLLPE